MSNEVSQQQSFGSKVIGYSAMPSLFLGAGALSSIKAHSGVRNAIKAQEREAFKMYANSLDKDVFTKGIELSGKYDVIQSASKTAARAQKKYKKALKKGDIGLKDKAFNLVKKDKTTLDTLETASKKANKALDSAKDTIKTSSAALDSAKTAVKFTQKGLKDSAKSLFKKEIKSKFNIVMTAVTFIPNVITKVIPTFKNEGFAAGMKEAGKTFIQAGTDFLSYAAGGAIGRVLGTTIGTILCPGVGSAIGGQIGDMVGSVVVGGGVTKAVDKAVGADEEIEVAAQSEQTQQLTSDANSIPQDLYSKKLQQDLYA